MKFLRYLLLLPLFLGLNSCMEYDMSYPRILAEFVEFDVQGAKKVTIDPSNMVVNIDLAEEESLSAVKVNSVKLNDKSYFKDGEFPEVLDLREPYSVILSLYQDYRWTIKASQSVDRVFKCANQVGAPTFDTDHNEIIAYVSNTQRLKNLRVDEMKLELIGSKVVRTTGRVLVDNQVQEITQDCEFPMELDCTLKRSFDVEYKGAITTWNLTVVPVNVPAQITSIAAWCWSADIYATFDGTSEPPVFNYRKFGELEWTTVPQEIVEVDGVNVHVHLTELEQAVGYETMMVFNGEELPGIEFTTDTPQQLFNMNFDQWSYTGSAAKQVWFPYPASADASMLVWDSANKGAAEYIGSLTMPEYNDVAVAGGAAAKLVSKYAVVKFAAGNLYTGQFIGLVGIKGADIDWGVPFNAKPKALKGYYKYSPAMINYKNNSEVASPTELDMCQLQVILMDHHEPYKVLPVGDVNGPTIDGELIDLETHPSIIARAIVNLEKSDVDGDGTADWVEFELPLEYRNYRTPKYAIVTAASSYLGDYFTGGHGSTMLVDEFEFVYE